MAALAARLSVAGTPEEALIDGTWLVDSSEGSFGTAFLVHSDSQHSYFATASHVVAEEGDPGETKIRTDLLLEKLWGGEKVTRSAGVVGFWCEKMNFKKNVCAKGADAALLRTQRVPEGVEPFELGFAASVKRDFSGHFAGYSARAVGAAPSPRLIFTTVDVAAHTKYVGYFEPGSTVYYQTSGESSPGSSGGPISVLANDRYEVVGILSWREPGFDPDDAAGPSFAATVGVLRLVWDCIPVTENVSQLSTELTDRLLSRGSLEKKLSDMSNGEIVTLIDLMRGEEAAGSTDRVTPAYWAALYDQAASRRLDYEKLFLEPKVRLADNPGWIREAAKTRRRLADALMLGERVGDRELKTAPEYLVEATDLNERFLRLAKGTEPDWYGPRVFGDVAEEMSYAFEQLGQLDEALAWKAAGARVGVPNATAELAQTAFRRGEFQNAAGLYVAVRDQRRRAGLGVPDYVSTSYADSVAALERMGAEGVQFPHRLEGVDEGAMVLELDSIGWLGDRWKDLVNEFALEDMM